MENHLANHKALAGKRHSLTHRYTDTDRQLSHTHEEKERK